MTTYPALQNRTGTVRMPFLRGSTRRADGAEQWAPIAPDPQPVHQRPGQPVPATALSVGPGTPWAHPRAPHPEATPSVRAAAVGDYAVWIAGRPDLLDRARRELAGHDLACTCPPGPCHRDVLIDIANPPIDPLDTGTSLMGLTMNRPAASLLLVQRFLGGITVLNKTFAPDYRGPVAIFASPRINERDTDNARLAGLAADWHAAQRGWLGTTVLIETHPARAHCCAPSARAHRGDGPAPFHWIFAHPARLALPTHGHGFAGLRPVSWSALVRRNALGFPTGRKSHHG